MTISPEEGRLKMVKRVEKEKTEAGREDQQKLTLDKVEALWVLADAMNDINKSQGIRITELQTKLKETIRAVERLAKGKSLGCLGLPTEESWS